MLHVVQSELLPKGFGVWNLEGEKDACYIIFDTDGF